MHDPTHPPRTWQLLSTTWPSVWAIGRGERERGLHRTNSAVSTGAGPSACMIAISPVSPWCGGSWDGRQHALGARFDPNPMSKRDMAGKQKHGTPRRVITETQTALSLCTSYPPLSAVTRRSPRCKQPFPVLQEIVSVQHGKRGISGGNTDNKKY